MRPRVRYLYFHRWTCFRRLALAGGTANDEVVKREFDEPFLRAIGRYFKRSMIVTAAMERSTEISAKDFSEWTG